MVLHDSHVDVTAMHGVETGCDLLLGFGRCLEGDDTTLYQAKRTVDGLDHVLDYASRLLATQHANPAKMSMVGSSVALLTITL